MKPIRLLLVDDSPEFLDSAIQFLRLEPQITIVGYADDGDIALQLIRATRPDLVVMDWKMPRLNGLETTRLIKQQRDAPRVIILTLYDNAEYRAAALIAHADGFVAKSEFGTQLLPLVRQWFVDTPANPIP